MLKDYDIFVMTPKPSNYVTTVQGTTAYGAKREFLELFPEYSETTKVIARRSTW